MTVCRNIIDDGQDEGTYTYEDWTREWDKICHVEGFQDTKERIIKAMFDTARTSVHYSYVFAIAPETSLEGRILKAAALQRARALVSIPTDLVWIWRRTVEDPVFCDEIVWQLGTMTRSMTLDELTEKVGPGMAVMAKLSLGQLIPLDYDQVGTDAWTAVASMTDADHPFHRIALEQLAARG